MHTPAPWMTRAWTNWHRPWAVTHASWLHETPEQAAVAGSGELALRLHYPAWCEQHALAPVLDRFEDSTWWRLFGLADRAFDQTVRRVGLSLMFAGDPRRRMMRRADDDLEIVRWSLGRAPFVPENVTLALRAAELPATESAHAALALSWCLVDAPALWGRLRLRFAPQDLQATDDLLRSADADPDVRAWLATLWSAGVRLAYKETSA